MKSRTTWERTPAIHGTRSITEDPPHERELAAHLATAESLTERIRIFERFADGSSEFDAMMRRILVRSIARKCGDGLIVAPRAIFRHLETLEFGNGVFLAEASFIQGRHEGQGIFGNKVWIGSGAVIDARDIVVGDYVGIGAGVRILATMHAPDGDGPLISRDNLVGPIRIHDDAFIGTAATLMPGVTIGARAVVAPGAMVLEDVPDDAVVVGIPARVVKQGGRRI